MDFSNFRSCARCGNTYDWRKSSSDLKMTYCGVICERIQEGFTIVGITDAIKQANKSRIDRKMTDQMEGAMDTAISLLTEGQ